MYNQNSNIDAKNVAMIGAKDAANNATSNFTKSESNNNFTQKYTSNMATQLRKGSLPFLVLAVANMEISPQEILSRLAAMSLPVSPGTIYPLLTRLAKDGLLASKWQEVDNSTPRKVFQITDLGREVMENLRAEIESISHAVAGLSG